MSGGYKNMWYSFDYGPVHVIMLNTGADFVNVPAGPGTALNADHFVGTSAQSIQSLFLFLWSHALDNAGNIVAKGFKNVDSLIHVTDRAGAAPSDAEKVRIIDTDRQAWFFGGYGFHQLLIKDSSQASLNFIDSSTTTIIKSVDIIRNR
ncbi:unnamed protein product [Adineta ricciae]|uniref:Uncharacterized protein n=1 Tax=Adineta ricciae TaxID=249248 RepID=A0A814M9P8_ADIRI|nr:unnamed protein product [Adineta ricciae]CAF1652935.1 unnamed protein product [Adineta ricciae]